MALAQKMKFISSSQKFFVPLQPEIEINTNNNELTTYT